MPATNDPLVSTEWLAAHLNDPDVRVIDASFKMAELSLLPAVRKADADTLVVADGTSCRHQIKDGAGREAIHVARVVAMSVAAARQSEDTQRPQIMTSP